MKVPVGGREHHGCELRLSRDAVEEVLRTVFCMQLCNRVDVDLSINNPGISTRQNLVTGLVMGSTDMIAGYEGEINRPANVVRAALSGVEANKLEILVDEASAQAKAALAADPSVSYPQTVSKS